MSLSGLYAISLQITAAAKKPARMNAGQCLFPILSVIEDLVFKLRNYIADKWRRPARFDATPQSILGHLPCGRREVDRTPLGDRRWDDPSSLFEA